MTDNTNLSVVQDGTTSIGLDPVSLAAVGLTLSSTENTVEPISDEFAAGFDITEASDFFFSNQNVFTPIAGEIEHSGTVTFSSGAGDITVGNFTIDFDPSRQTESTSGFFVQNRVPGVLPDGAILFDVGIPESVSISNAESVSTSNGESVSAAEGKLNLLGTDLLVAPEFAAALLETGLATDNLTGADIGDAAVNAITDPIEETVYRAQINDGTTSVALNTDLLSSAAGLSVTGVENTVAPVDGFAVGFDITEGSQLILSADVFADPNDLTPEVGFADINHTGTVTFSSSAGDITVGDFSIGYDVSRQTEDTSGFFLENTVDGVVPDGAILFDVGIPESVRISDIDPLGGSVDNFGPVDLLVAPEFATLLSDAGLAASDLTGADVGDAATSFTYDVETL